MAAEIPVRTLLGPRPLRLSDSPALDELVRRAAQGLPSSAAEDLLRPETMAIEWIRARLEEERTGAAWTTALDDGTGTLAGVAGLRRIDPIRSTAEMMLLADPQADAVPPLLDRILKTAFYHYGLHRIELRVPVGSTLGEAAAASGWNEEGRLAGALPSEDGFQDARLLSVLRSGFDGYGIAFVPFARGYVHLAGDREAVETIGFLRPDLPIGPGALLATARERGVCDRSGNVLPAGASEGGGRGVRLPAEVEKAARQVREYLVGTRTVFDFRTKANGSLFQQKVWALLEEIPYGATLTYEDVAHRLTPGDPAAARRLTRAVGSACSANPLAIVVPCHRVIGKDNKLVGFSGGIDVKEWLLEHEMLGVR